MPETPHGSVWIPLNAGEIRIICLQPGSWGDPLVATLEHHLLEARSFEERYERCDSLQRDDLAAIETLRSENGYEAISYAWEDYDLSQNLSIEGKGKINITQSLFAALQQFRWRATARRLWADAISINQADNREKAAQVAIMHTIFGSADMVLIWLGPARLGDELAFAMIRHYDIREHEGSEITDLQILTQVEEKIRASPRCPCCSQPIDDRQTGLGIAGLHGILNLLRRSWFTCLWTVQEVDIRATPAQIFSGSHCALMVQFVMAIYFLGDVIRSGHLPMAKEAAKNIQNAIHQVNHEYGGRAPTTRNFWSSFTPFSRRNCSDPRDRIYAIRNCLGLEYLDDLAPDYTISAQECYRRLTWTMLQEENFPGLATDGPPFPTQYRLPWIPLSLVGTETPTEDLDSAILDEMNPSWIPDLHRLSERSRDKLSLMTEPAPRELFGNNAERFNCCVDPRDETRIQLQGRCFAQLSTPSMLSMWPRTQMLSPETIEGEESIAQIFTWYRYCREFARPILSEVGSEAIETFHRFLICGLELSNTEELSTRSQLLADQLSEAWYPAETATVRPYTVNFLQNIDLAFIDKDRTLCMIGNQQNKDLAWVPKGSMAGDRMCVFAGSPFPFVVRQRDDGSFKLIGDAYTACGTLKEALGGEDNHAGIRPSSEDAIMSWSTNDEEMIDLMDRLGWITLS